MSLIDRSSIELAHLPRGVPRGVVEGYGDRPVVSYPEVCTDISSRLDRVTAKEAGVEVVTPVLREE